MPQANPASGSFAKLYSRARSGYSNRLYWFDPGCDRWHLEYNLDKFRCLDHQGEGYTRLHCSRGRNGKAYSRGQG